MTPDDIMHALSGLPFCQGLAEGVLAALSQCAAPRHFRAGETIFFENSRYEDLLLVQAGRVQLQMRVPGRGAVPILTIGPGQFVAWSTLVGTGEMTTSAVAMVETDVLALPSESIRRICQENPEFGYRFMTRLADALAQRLVATRLQLLDLFADEPPRLPEEERVDE